MRDLLHTFLIVSVAYIVTFSLTFGFVFPLQQLLFSGVSTQVGLLFLPHGVRVITLYFYGWRGMFYLLPASYLMILISVEQTGQDFADVLAEAQHLGYAEAEPSFDVDGIDAAHKLTILAAIAFGQKPDFAAALVQGIRDVSAVDFTFANQLGFRIKLVY